MLQHSVALHRSEFVFFLCRLCATSVIIPSFFFIDTTSFSLTSHLQVYRLLPLSILLLTVKLFFSLSLCYVVASDYFQLCGLTTCFNFGVLELHMFAVSLIRDVLF
jgi:hypothetical protein